jgi:hypothetical protein
MALFFRTTAPTALLNDFKKKIDQGHIVTWSCDKDGDFTHTPDQWKYKAWMRPSIDIGGLRFNFVANAKVITDRGLYGVYHGRLSESFITHCQDLFSEVSATAYATNADILTRQAA